MVLLASPFISFLEVGCGKRLLFYHHFQNASNVLIRGCITLETPRSSPSEYRSRFGRPNEVEIVPLVGMNESIDDRTTSGWQSALPSDAIQQSDMTVLLEIDSTVSLEELQFYKYRWFRELIKLIYCISLGTAGFILVMFSLFEDIKDIHYVRPELITPWAKWLAFNVGVFWVFTFVGVSTFDTDPVPLYKPASMSRKALSGVIGNAGGRLAPTGRTWINSLAWNGLILALTAASVVLGLCIFPDDEYSSFSIIGVPTSGQ